LTIYTITASNSAGSTTTALSITVNIAPPTGLAYSTPSAYYTVDIPIPENFPIVTGGSPTTYSVTPTLPDGLTLRTDTPPYGPYVGTLSAGVIS
jgi:hypothetical protein